MKLSNILANIFVGLPLIGFCWLCGHPVEGKPGSTGIPPLVRRLGRWLVQTALPALFALVAWLLLWCLLTSVTFLFWVLDAASRRAKNTDCLALMRSQWRTFRTVALPSVGQFLLSWLPTNTLTQEV